MSPRERLHLKILTPQGIILERDALTGVNVPLADGLPIGIRPGHAPLIAETAQGRIRYRTTTSEADIELHAGVLEVRQNDIMILTAGKVSETPPEISTQPEKAFDRLMQTLIDKLVPEQEEKVS